MPQLYWLMKSEPSELGVEDAWRAPAHRVPWQGVRNYQARNFLRDAMQPGDGVLFYHSSCATPGIVGLARVVSDPEPDALQFDPTSPYFDPRSTRERPVWVSRGIEVTALLELIPIAALRTYPELAAMLVLARGNRLSITPVTEDQFLFITRTLARERPDVF